MIALITANVYDEFDNETHTHHIVREMEGNTCEEVGRYIDSVFGTDAESFKVEFIDSEAIYVNEEIFEGLRTDKYLQADFGRTIIIEYDGGPDF